MGESRNNTTGNNTGVAGICTNTVTTFPVGSYPQGLENTGVSGTAFGSKISNSGVKGFAEEVVPQGTDYVGGIWPINAGVRGKASGSRGSNRSGMFICEGRNGGNYAVWSRTTYGPAPNPWSPVPPPGAGVVLRHYAGFFLGHVYYGGLLIGPSDVIFKDSIQDLTGSLSTLSMLQPKSFVYRTDSFPYMNLPYGSHHMGLIAQQVDSVLPEIVHKVYSSGIEGDSNAVLMDSMTFKGINYMELIPLTISGINELNETKVGSIGNGDSNYVTKWSATNKTLANSSIYDDGEHVSIIKGANLTGATFTVTTDTDSAAVQGEGAIMGARFRGQNAGITGIANGNEEYDFFQAGVIGICENSPEINVGVLALAKSASDTAVNVGMLAFGWKSQYINAGIAGLSEWDDSAATNSINYGVVGVAAGSLFENRGGYFEVYEEDTASTAEHYAVYAHAENTDSNFYAGYFEGNLVYTGNLVGPSDGKLKENVTEITDALPRLMQLQPKEYEFKTDEYKSMGLPQGKQFGLIAEEAERVIPELVHNIISPEHRRFSDSSNLAPAPQAHYKGINYMELLPWMLKAMQEQQAIIDSLAKELGEVKTSVMNCCGSEIQYRNTDTGENTQEEPHQLTVELNALQIVILEQNAPNPFAEQTSISYFVPEDAGKAQMQFTDLAGRVIKTVELEKGSGILTVFAQNLGSGTYSYSLIVDGKVMETKKMVKMR